MNYASPVKRDLNAQKILIAENLERTVALRWFVGAKSVTRERKRRMTIMIPGEWRVQVTQLLGFELEEERRKFGAPGQVRIAGPGMWVSDRRYGDPVAPHLFAEVRTMSVDFVKEKMMSWIVIVPKKWMLWVNDPLPLY